MKIEIEIADWAAHGLINMELDCNRVVETPKEIYKNFLIYEGYIKLYQSGYMYLTPLGRLIRDAAIKAKQNNQSLTN